MALVACTPQPSAAAHLKFADIQPILQPLALRELLGEKCGVPNTAVKTAFLEDLKAQGATAELQAQAKAEADRITALSRDEPAEYVCTPELMESTATTAFAARAVWSEMKAKRK